VGNEDGALEISRSKYNSKYILGNLLVCGNCGMPYRRRTERGKVVWRCATRIEKGRHVCSNSPTLYEGCVQGILAKYVCFNGIYDENIIRNEIDKIHVSDTFIVIFYKNGLKEKKSFLNN
jgi:site-specific DNA recombinase